MLVNENQFIPIIVSDNTYIQLKNKIIIMIIMAFTSAQHYDVIYFVQPFARIVRVTHRNCLSKNRYFRWKCYQDPFENYNYN